MSQTAALTSHPAKGSHAKDYKDMYVDASINNIILIATPWGVGLRGPGGDSQPVGTVQPVTML